VCIYRYREKSLRKEASFLCEKEGILLGREVSSFGRKRESCWEERFPPKVGKRESCWEESLPG